MSTDTVGNALSIFAIAIVPMLALVGSSIDMGRAYLVESRLQQACDAGVLGARKELGTITNFDPATDGGQIATKGNRFFNANFADGIYDSIDRAFDMAIEDDNSITGTASVILPTSVMQFFGRDEISISVTCRAELTIPNTDIM
ncbi:MAG: Tad domain-containing protein, partial [Novosphingobium sp.]